MKVSKKGMLSAVLSMKMISTEAFRDLIKFEEREIEALVEGAGVSAAVSEKIIIAKKCNEDKGYLPEDLIRDIISTGKDILLLTILEIQEVSKTLDERLTDLKESTVNLDELNIDYTNTYNNLYELINNDFSYQRFKDKVYPILLSRGNGSTHISEKSIAAVYTKILESRYSKLKSAVDLDFKHHVFASRINSLVGVYSNWANDGEYDYSAEQISQRARALGNKESDYDQDNVFTEILETPVIDEVVSEENLGDLKEMHKNILELSKEILDVDLSGVKDIVSYDALDISKEGFLDNIYKEAENIISDGDSANRKAFFFAHIVYVVALTQRDINEFIMYRNNLNKLMVSIKKDTFDTLKETNDTINVHLTKK